MEDANSNNRRKGLRAGLILIVLGVVGAIVIYINDVNSLDYRMGMAWNFAVLHLVLWTVAGLGVIAWYNRPPVNELPFEPREDDNNDSVR